MLKHALVVPVKVHSLVVDSFVKDHVAFNRFQMNYNELTDHLSPEPLPFGDVSTNDPIEIGVYVHWHLPAGLTQARQKADGTMEYPLVPNRWLVIRQIGSGPDQQTAAWIIESDRLDTPQGSAFCIYNEQGKKVQPTKIGKKVSLTSWREDDGNKSELFLTAAGAGDLTYSFYQPSCQNVFSIYDPLLDHGTNEINEAEIDYTVLGWFSNEAGDPLHEASKSEQWKQIAEEYGWRVSDGTPEHIVNSTLFRGAVKQVKWKRNVDQQQHPEMNNPNKKVVVGLTSVDATAELLGSYSLTDNDDIDKLLEAYQYDQLRSFDEPGEEETLDERIHKSGFHSSCGGTIWIFEDRNKTDPPPTPSQIQQVIQKEEKMLARLNELQVMLDKEKRDLATMQQHAYELWWKLKQGIIDGFILMNYLWEIKNNKIWGIEKVLKPAVHEKMKEIIQHQRDHDSPKRLTHSAMPRFWSPKDPVVLVTGLQKSSLESQRGMLVCQTLTYNPDSMYRCHGLNLDHVPTDIAALLCNGPDTSSDPLWKQPWLPLFLEWEIQWWPIQNWSFDGYDRNAMGKSTQSPRSYKGRTILGPHAVFSLKERLLQFANGLPEEPPEDVMNFILSLENWDILSQTLEGLQQSLLQRDTRIHPMPGLEAERLISLIGDQSFLMPDKDSCLDPNDDTPYFQPFRCGQFVITKLRVVDGFGRMEDVPVSQTEPMISEALRTENEQPGIAELRPRLAQGARLNFNWVSTKTGKDIQLEAGASPIYGWILPNHLDRGLAIFNPKGEPLGQIRFKGRIEEKQEVVWYGAPGTDYDKPEKFKSKCPKLYDFVQGALKAKFEGFGTLSKVIDETLWVVDPKNNLFDQSMAAFIGRPLVLAKAKLSIDINGIPMEPVNKHQRIKYLEFEVALGNLNLRNDGLMGYFLNDDYSRFFSVYKPCLLQEDSSGNVNCAQTDYIIQIGSASHENQAYVTLNLDETSEKNCEYVTMLMDPLAMVHARSGCLPWKELELPAKFKNEALQKIQAYFNMGPLLTTKKCGDEANDYQLLFPKPSERFGSWSWMERSNNKDKGHPWVSFPIKDQDQKDLPTRENPTVREGLFNLKPNNLT